MSTKATIKQVPGSLRSAKIGDVIRRKTKNVDPQSFEEEYPYVGLENITQGTFELTSIGNASEVRSSKYQFKAGDTLFGKLRPYFHKTVQLDFDGVCSTDIWVLRSIDNSVLDNAFLSYLARTKHFCDMACATSGGTDRPRAKWKAFSQLEINLPSLPIQKRIVACLSAFDDLIENNKRRIEILEEMARTIYREWFVNFRYPGHEDDEMVDSELGEIPAVFEVKSRDAIVERLNSREDSAELPPDTPYVGLENIPEKTIAMKSWSRVCEVKSAKYRFRIDDILFAKLRPYLHKCVFAPIEGVVSTDAFVFRPKKQHFFGWALMHLSSDEFVESANTNTKGTNRPRANWKALKRQKVPFPPDHLARKFDTFVRSISGKIKNSIQRNASLRDTRDLLLPRLISGEIDVQDLDTLIPEDETTEDGNLMAERGKE